MSPFTLHPVGPDQKATVANLIQLYLHDMTELMPFPVGPDGRYAYDFLDRFWRYPYLIMTDGGEIAGFALVVDSCPVTGQSPCWFMAEFFVLKGYRRCGAGRAAVEAAIAAHPGTWHIGVPFRNRAAAGFWSRVLFPYATAVQDLVFEQQAWRVHSFTA